MLEALLGLGYGGLFIACFISGTIIPFSSDIILITLVAVGWNYKVCIIVATIANWAGGMVNYFLGRKGKMDWIYKHSNIKPEKLEKIQTFLQGKGAYMAFFSIVPVVGHVMVVALGLMKANVWIVNISLFLGKFLRYVLIIFLTLKGVDLIDKAI